MCKRPFPLSSRSIRVIYVFAAIILPALLFWQFQQAFAAKILPNMDEAQLQPLNNAIIPPTQTNIQPTLIRHYASPQTYQTTQLAWGDMDGDGDLDLAVGNRRNQPNHIYKNEGQGNFSMWNLSDIGNNTQSVAWGDMDGDGDLDLAVGNAGNWSGECLCFQGIGARNELYRNDGFMDGQVKFTQLPLGSDAKHTLSVAWGDLDGNGYLDLVVGNWGDVNQVYQNNKGQLELVPGNPLGSEKNHTASVALGNIYKDSDLDLAVGNGGWSKSNDSYQMEMNHLYRNISENGQIKFELVPNALGTDAKLTTSVAWGDVEGDGDLDLAVGNWGQPLGGGDVNQVYLNDGTGEFKAEDAIAINDEKNTRSVAWGDIDGDGDLDLAVANEHGNGGGQTDQIYRYDKEQNSFAIVEIDKELDQAETNSMGWGDMDGDGDLDLAVGSAFGGALFIYRNTRQPIFEQSDLPESQPSHTEIVAWGDVDKDGRLDLAIGNLADGNYVYHNDGQGKFTPCVLPNSKNARSMAWGDMNGDGYLDLVVGAGGEGGIPEVNQLYKNITTTTGETGACQFELVPNALGSDAKDTFSVAWGDVDGDGDLDLALGNNNDVNQLYENTDGKGAFELVPDALGEDKGWTHSLAWGDMDGDGDLDLAVGNWQGQPSQILVNIGKGEFSPINLGAEASGAESVAWGDMDGDGDLDLAVANRLHANVIFRNEGQGRFVPLTLDNLTKNSQSIAWGDMDGDGDLDLAVGNYGVDQIYINDGFGNFSPYDLSHASLDNRTASVAWGDMDGDGDLDLALGTYNRNLVLTNHIQTESSTSNAAPFIRVGGPNDSSADFYAISNIVNGRVISIPFTTFGAEGDKIHWIKGEYSLDGGGRWRPAVATSKTITTNLAVSSWPTGTEYTYAWDTFDRGFFGRSDNVVFRISAYSQSPASAPTITGTYRYTNRVAGSFQRPYAAATTYPFRVQGTQVQVFSETIASANAMADASVYLLREGNFTAQLMGSPAANRPFVTDENGFLNGRGPILENDTLFAALPITEAYRIPPQLIFSERGGQILVEPQATTPFTFTAEFWVHPISNTGTLVQINDNDFILAYETHSEITTLSLTIADKTVTTTEVLLNNGQAHHLAFSWASADQKVALYADGQQIISETLSVHAGFGNQMNKIAFGSDFEGALDEIRLWKTIRNPDEIRANLHATNKPFSLSSTHFLTVNPEFADDLIGYWPIQQDDGGTIKDWSLNGNVAQVIDEESGGGVGTIYIGYKPLFTIYHTSGAVTETVSFQPLAKDGGVQQITVSKENPLILFDLDVSLEWDARNDSIFLQQLEDSFVRASALLYDVSNGQAALGQINLYHDKIYWGAADIVVYADNSLRPSAAIGGVVNRAVSDTIKIDDSAAMSITAYLPGQIRMGTSWDPYGETTTDLGEDWTRALAHELSHYLLFLPDNYLGIDNGRFTKVNCEGSFMTTTSDPQYSEFLSRTEWDQDADCQETFANKLTGRADWDTITEFYPMLITPTQKIEGPPDLPLAVTYLIPWVREDDPLPFPARNFDIRNEAGKRWRLPNAQAFLIKTQGTITITNDDVLIPLGNPTGGGDRLKVRGAEAGDKLCIFDSSGEEHYTGCIETLTADVAAITMITNTNQLQPKVKARSIDAYTVEILVTSTAEQNPDDELNVQLFPLHYGSTPGNAPQITMTYGVLQQINMKLPAYEIAVHVWANTDSAETQESITIVRLNPETWELKNNAYQRFVASDLKSLIYSPIVAGPDTSIIGGPDTSIIGGPDTSIIGGPDTSIIGGSGRALLGGPDTSIIGGPDTSIIGGPDTSIIGGPDTSIIGGGTRAASAPILSADAQVVIYDKNNFFEDNGVKSIQALPNFPEQIFHPWLVLVGQAYHVELNENDQARFISFTYLQREVPDGYEDTLTIYFLKDGEQTWRPITDTKRFTENLIVATLQPHNGIYAVMSTIQMPSLQEGWNLLNYPLLITRTVTESMRSVATVISPAQLIVHEPLSTDVRTISETRASVIVHSVSIRENPAIASNRLGYLLQGDNVRVKRIDEATKWLEIDCPSRIQNQNCWITPNELYVSVKAPRIINSVDGLIPPANLEAANRAEYFRFGRVYWVYIEAIPDNHDAICSLQSEGRKCVDLFFAPPQVGPNGITR